MVEGADLPPGPERHPAYCGRYRLLQVLGEGGMGTVYLAEQTEPIERRVALKLVKLGMDSKEVVARFERERQALALMSHDGIAKVYDCGVSDRGQPYFVMELVRGIPLDTFCDSRKVSLQRRLRLVKQLCSAVQHAHTKGIVHRDLKPGNVLVSDEGGKLQIKVIDFGLVKALGRKLVDGTQFTEVGAIMGTPEYMAPEQADPSNLDIDTRVDIYAIGVILYQLTVGSLPFSSARLRSGGWMEMQRILSEEEPDRPSTRLAMDAGTAAAVAAARRTTPAALQKALKSDLDWVVRRAMEKDRNLRYETASSLAEDLQRFLDDEPLQAGPPSAGYLLRKLLRRRRPQLIFAASVFVTALVGAVVASAFAISSSRSEARLAGKVRDFNLLSGVTQRQRLIEQERDLHPALGARIEALREWLAHPLHGSKSEYEREVIDLAAKVDASAADDAVPAAERESLQLLYEQVKGLVDGFSGLERLAKSVAQRVRWEEEKWDASLRREAASARWAQAREAIAANPHYRDGAVDLRDANVVGLVPIGENPKTGLWEFLDLRSAWDGVGSPASIPIPKHRADGSIDVGADTGIVFVLLPGGRFTMISDTERSEVSLRPFFLARHELTCGQWLRLTGSVGPSSWDIGARQGGDPAVTLACPITDTNWVEADLWMRRHGLSLPTEAQWEYGCRAGSQGAASPWFTGTEPGTLQGYANILDASGYGRSKHNLHWGDPEIAVRDGYFGIAAVGRFQCNAFGLYDVHGNVAEWCGDVFAPYHRPTEPGTGLRRVTGADANRALRIHRGGSYQHRAAACRSGARSALSQEIRQPSIGLRAARLLGD